MRWASNGFPRISTIGFHAEYNATVPPGSSQRPILPILGFCFRTSRAQCVNKIIACVTESWSSRSIDWSRYEWVDFTDCKTSIEPTIDMILMMVGPAQTSMESNYTSERSFTFRKIQFTINACFRCFLQTSEYLMKLKWGARLYLKSLDHKHP